ncbi:MAG: hypothetical protein IPO30_08065 [Hyphomonadaceae bacterium]|nr:hypothetical protein [Hyphomonadaceae bacterium]
MTALVEQAKASGMLTATHHHSAAAAKIFACQEADLCNARYRRVALMISFYRRGE